MTVFLGMSQVRAESTSLLMIVIVAARRRLPPVRLRQRPPPRRGHDRRPLAARRRHRRRRRQRRPRAGAEALLRRPGAAHSPSSSPAGRCAIRPRRSESRVPDSLRVNHELEIPLSEIELRASRSSGPGGQHANVTASRIEAVFDLRGLAQPQPPAALAARPPSRPAGDRGRPGRPQSVAQPPAGTGAAGEEAARGAADREAETPDEAQPLGQGAPPRAEATSLRPQA